MKTHPEVVAELAELRREFQTVREDMRELRGPHSSEPMFNAVSGSEFLALFQAHRSLREDYERLRERVAALEEAK